MWVTTTDLPTAASHPFYRRLNQLLRERRFDDFAEAQCASFYAETMGRPGLPPGIYFRLLLVGYFEGIDSERGIAWRAADSLALRDFLGIGLDEPPPDHSTISRTRRLIDLETHRAVFTWVLQCLRCHDNGDCCYVDASGALDYRHPSGLGEALKGRANRQKTAAEQMRPNVPRRPLRREPVDRPARDKSIWHRRKTR
jgi:transposase